MGYRALLRLLNLSIVSSDIDEPSSSCGLGCLLIQGNRLRQFLGSFVSKSEVLSQRKKERRGIPLRIHVGHLLKQEVLCVGTLCGTSAADYWLWCWFSGLVLVLLIPEARVGTWRTHVRLARGSQNVRDYMSGGWPPKLLIKDTKDTVVDPVGEPWPWLACLYIVSTSRAIAYRRGARKLQICRIMVSQLISLFRISQRFREPNRTRVNQKRTHRLGIPERSIHNQQTSLSELRLLGGGSNLINKATVLHMERLPWQMSSNEHW